VYFLPNGGGTNRAGYSSARSRSCSCDDSQSSAGISRLGQTGGGNGDLRWEQSRDLFWKAHDYLFRAQPDLSAATVRAALMRHLNSVPLFRQPDFEECLGSGQAEKALLEDENLGQSLGITATPTFYVNGVKQVGLGDPQQFKEFLLRKVDSMK